MLPFLKWAGGKRWLFTFDFLGSLPSHERYIEPFLGGGAGFFALKPKNALLADLNPDLINAYSVVRDNPRELRIALEEHQSRHSDDHYYAVRASKPDDALGRGARFLYLNRACWNGLYRVNQLGNFNVPKGTKTSMKTN